MKNGITKAALNAAARLAREESGMALMLTLGAFLFLFVVCCGVYATGESVRQKVELQNAVDAAAYSAAVVQADGLSRIATLNRAMAWSYIQLTKMQMDYIAYRWLRLTHKRFTEDYALAKAAHGREILPPMIPVGDLMLYLNNMCVHNPPHTTEPAGFYAGSCLNVENPNLHGQNTVHAIRVNHSMDKELRLNNSGDLDLYVHGEKVFENLVGNLSGLFDGGAASAALASTPAGALAWGESLAETIEGLKTGMAMFQLMLNGVNLAMHQDVRETIERVFFDNLPRGLDGELDKSILDDFYYTTRGGLSSGPKEYPAVDDSGTYIGIDIPDMYFKGLRNTEEDELLFLNMANGVPGNTEHVTLKDYFGGAYGLDQWFIRCDPAEFHLAGETKVERGWTTPMTGIARGYKNANYEEGAGGMFQVHRGNSVFTMPALPTPQLFSGLVGEAVNPFISPFLEQINPVNMLGNQMMGILGDLVNIPPSCVNLRRRFVDKCANVDDTFGLCAEYEWGTARWICVDWRLVDMKTGIQWGHDNFHIPLPLYMMSTGCGPHGYPGGLFGSAAALAKMVGAGGMSRAEYRSCFTGVGGTTLLRNHARIYGDDIEICNPHYVGTPAMPWVLDERFYEEGVGTIWVGGARLRRNPFERLLGEITEKNVFALFSPPRGEHYITAMSAARAGHSPRTGTAGAGPADSINNPPNLPQGVYELRFDSVTDKKFKPHLDAKTAADWGASKKQDLEENGRLGCACGEHETEGGVYVTDRLRRQWNLSQNDWDAMLLPVRYAFAGTNSKHDSADPKANPSWSITSPGGGESDGLMKFMSALMEDLRWRNASGDNKPSREILPGFTPETLHPLFRLRRIL